MELGSGAVELAVHLVDVLDGLLEPSHVAVGEDDGGRELLLLVTGGLGGPANEVDGIQHGGLLVDSWYS